MSLHSDEGANTAATTAHPVRVAYGTGRMHDQPASFTIAAGDGGHAIWVAATADGRAETAIVEPERATAKSWSTGARYTLEVDELERQVAIVRAIIDGTRAGGSLELATVGGTQRLTLGHTRIFDGLTFPASVSLQANDQL